MIFIVEINNSFYSVISENIVDSFITEKKKLFFLMHIFKSSNKKKFHFQRMQFFFKQINFLFRIIFELLLRFE